MADGIPSTTSLPNDIGSLTLPMSPPAEPIPKPWSSQPTLEPGLLQMPDQQPWASTNEEKEEQVLMKADKIWEALHDPPSFVNELSCLAVQCDQEGLSATKVAFCGQAFLLAIKSYAKTHNNEVVIPQLPAMLGSMDAKL